MPKDKITNILDKFCFFKKENVFLRLNLSFTYKDVSLHST